MILKEKDIQELTASATGLMQMYQAGFLDGCKYTTPIAEYRGKNDQWIFNIIKKQCFKAFKKRFKKDVKQTLRQRKKKRV